MKHIKINFLTYYLLLIYFLCGLIKEGIIVFIIVIFHEMGHIFFAKLFKYNILSVEIFPFGGLTKLSKDINTPCYKDILLSSGGCIFQILLYYIYYSLHNFGIISSDAFSIFCNYNISIIVFNLLPISSLDGSFILEAVLNIFFSYKKSLFLTLIFSIISLILFLQFSYIYNLNVSLVISLLIYKIILSAKNNKHLYNKFLLERHLKDFQFKKISHSRSNDVSILKKNTFFYFWFFDKWKSEKKILEERFDKHHI